MAEINDVILLLKKTAEALVSIDVNINTKRIDAQIYEKKLNKSLEDLDKANEKREALKADIEALEKEYREKQAEIAQKIAFLGQDATARLAEAEKFRKQAEADASIASELRLSYEEKLLELSAQKERILSAVK